MCVAEGIFRYYGAADESGEVMIVPQARPPGAVELVADPPLQFDADAASNIPDASLQEDATAANAPESYPQAARPETVWGNAALLTHGLDKPTACPHSPQTDGGRRSLLMMKHLSTLVTLQGRQRTPRTPAGGRRRSHPVRNGPK